jgi:hypothetical protein
VFILLLCVPAVAPWREDGPSPTDRAAHVAACFAPPRRRRRLCADHRVEPYACRCRCHRPRARAPLDRHHWLSQWSCSRCIEL